MKLFKQNKEERSAKARKILIHPMRNTIYAIQILEKGIPALPLPSPPLVLTPFTHTHNKGSAYDIEGPNKYFFDLQERGYNKWDDARDWYFDIMYNSLSLFSLSYLLFF